MALAEERKMRMNKVMFMGRLTRDPEYRVSATTSVAKFSIAVERKYKKEGEPSADFFNCTTFGKQASFVDQYLRKGSKILLSGRLQNNSYTNKDGQNVRNEVVMVEEIEFAESKSNSLGANGTGNQNIGQPIGAVDADGFMNIPDDLDDELPFN